MEEDVLMAHDELLNRIKEGQWVDRQEMMLRSNALRAIVELHKPFLYPEDDYIYCEEDNQPYPCGTIQAIEKELG